MFSVLGKIEFKILNVGKQCKKIKMKIKAKTKKKQNI